MMGFLDLIDKGNQIWDNIGDRTNWAMALESCDREGARLA